jgi:hypothetical protein
MKKQLLRSIYRKANSLRLFTIIGCLTILSVTTSAQTIWIRSGNSIASVDAAAPDIQLTSDMITGIQAGQTIVGMDFRPLNGQLYLLGYESATGNSRIYMLSLNSFMATIVGAPFTLDTGQTEFGFDFNPTVDRIRITTLEGNNYRVHPVTGALVATDGDLAYAIGDSNEGETPAIGSVAYTNSYIGATSTTLYTYDDNLDIINTQVPPNNGTQNTVGSTGLMDIGSGELDIYYNMQDGTNTAYFKQEMDMLGGVSQLFTINLSTGEAMLMGTIQSTLPVEDIAVQITVAPPVALIGQLVYGLTSNGYLVSFDSENTAVIRSHQSISGLAMGQVIAGLDCRPATGELYALGYNSTTGEAQLYTLNPSTGAATSVGTMATLAMGMTHISFDFNPTVDRIRVTSAEDHNYRLHPVTGAIAATDGTLAYNGTDVNSAANPMIVAGAYTNSYIASTSTQLIGYDAALNVITLQNPPNNGTLNTIGMSGITVNAADPSVDLDFYFNMETGMNEIYLAANTGSSLMDSLYLVNIITGDVTPTGKIGFGTAITDIAVQIIPNIPNMVSGEIIYGITSNNYLITFDSEAPEVVRNHMAISGIATGQVIAGLDVRPATGELYALGYNAMTGEAQLYTITPSTGVATSVAMADTLEMNLGNIGFDFNPTVDRIRVVSSTGMNYRLHPLTGQVAFIDTNLAYNTGDDNEGSTPSIGSAAYTNSFGGSNNTQLYVYDDALNILALQNPPNAGTLNTIGISGLTQSAMDVTSDLDIFYDHELHTNTAFLVLNTNTNDNLYTVNTTTGEATAIGMVGNGIAVRDIAVLNDSITTVSSTSSMIDTSACDMFVAPNDIEYTLSGTYMVVIPNEAGYDSLLTIMLTINTVDNTISMTGPATVTATETGGMYQWFNCDDNTEIEGETMQSYTATTNGNYGVMITSAEGCSAMSDCMEISVVGIEEEENLFQVYPNPSSGLFYIVASKATTSNELILSDSIGREIFRRQINTAQTILDLSDMENGIYLLEINNQVHRLVKQ